MLWLLQGFLSHIRFRKRALVMPRTSARTTYFSLCCRLSSFLFALSSQISALPFYLSLHLTFSLLVSRTHSCSVVLDLALVLSHAYTHILSLSLSLSLSRTFLFYPGFIRSAIFFVSNENGSSFNVRLFHGRETVPNRRFLSLHFREYIYINIYIYIYIYVYMYIYIYIYLYMYVYVYIFIHTCIHIHTHLS